MIDECCVIELSVLFFFFTVRLPIHQVLTASSLHLFSSVSPNPGGLPSSASTRGDFSRHPTIFCHARAIITTPRTSALTITFPIVEAYSYSQFYTMTFVFLLTLSWKRYCVEFLFLLLRQPVHLSASQIDPYPDPRSADHYERRSTAIPGTLVIRYLNLSLEFIPL